MSKIEVGVNYVRIEMSIEQCVEIWEDIYRKWAQDYIEEKLKIVYEKKDWHELHIALWVWLSLDGERSKKKEWFEAFNVPEVRSHCFACRQSRGRCPHCPLTKSTANGCINGLYNQWWQADRLEQKEKLAREIATMKWEERL